MNFSALLHGTVTVYRTAVAARLLGLMYHYVCAVITARLMICYHVTRFFTSSVLMFLPYTSDQCTVASSFCLSAFWYERALLSYQFVFLHSDISDFIMHLNRPTSWCFVCCLFCMFLLSIFCTIFIVIITKFSLAIRSPNWLLAPNQKSWPLPLW